MKKYLLLSLCIFLPLMIGAVSGFFTTPNIPNWYTYLQKPSFNPPNWLFGPVWTILYVLMGISFFLIFQSVSNWKTKALGIFCIQLILNFLWSFIFFQQKQLGWALVELMVLWFCILMMIFIFYKVNKTAALLQIPYLLWVGFAGILNYFIFILNH